MSAQDKKLEQEKTSLRKEIQTQRELFYKDNPHTHADYSARIVQRLLQLIRTHKPKTLMAYYPLNSEVDIRPLLETLHREAAAPSMALPRTFIPSPPAKNDSQNNSQETSYSPQIKPVKLDKTHSLTSQLTPARYGIMEVREGKVLEASEIEFVIVPGLVFDETGHRLGYGGGYYDRFINRDDRFIDRAESTSATLRPPLYKVGVCFEFQRRHPLPTAAHDQPLSQLITEESSYTFTTP